MSSANGWGGRRAGSGRPQQRITLDLETANILREITRIWRQRWPEGAYTPTRVIEQFIYVEALKSGGEIDSPERERWLAIARGETPQ